jgi:hypothetical protein
MMVTSSSLTAGWLILQNNGPPQSRVLRHPKLHFIATFARMGDGYFKQGIGQTNAPGVFT